MPMTKFTMLLVHGGVVKHLYNEHNAFMDPQAYVSFLQAYIKITILIGNSVTVHLFLVLVPCQYTIHYIIIGPYTVSGVVKSIGWPMIGKDVRKIMKLQSQNGRFSVRFPHFGRRFQKM